MRIEAPEVDEFLEDERPSEAEELAIYALGPDDRASVRVLVIDDEASIRESCESVLKAEGYACDVDGRAEDALKQVVAPFESCAHAQRVLERRGSPADRRGRAPRAGRRAALRAPGILARRPPAAAGRDAARAGGRPAPGRGLSLQRWP